MQTFRITENDQSHPQWLTDAIMNGEIVVKGTSTSDYRVYVVNGITVGPGDRITFDGSEYQGIIG